MNKVKGYNYFRYMSWKKCAEKGAPILFQTLIPYMEQSILIFVKFTLSVTTKKTLFVSDENIVKSDVNDL
jgi:hypothetical protein